VRKSESGMSNSVEPGSSFVPPSHLDINEPL
jgi:hypothetical protein